MTLLEQRRRNIAKAHKVRSENKAILREEILWFRSFGWSIRRVADRLGVTVDADEKHLREHGAEETP